jgi:hypothetical protein
MSILHYDIIDKYGSYNLTSKSIKLERNHNVFRLYSENNKKYLLIGEHTPLAAFDKQKNTFVWSNKIKYLDQDTMKMIDHNINKIESEKKNSKFFEDVICIVTNDEVSDLMKDISKLLNKEIIVDYKRNNTVSYYHVVDKILANHI